MQHVSSLLLLCAVLGGCLPTDPPQRVVLFGDSISWSARATTGTATIGYVWQTERATYVVTVYAEPGCRTTPGTLMTCNKSAVHYTFPDVVVSWTGINDFRAQVPVANFQVAYGAQLDTFLADTPAVYCVQISWSQDEDQFTIPADMYRQAIVEECGARGLAVIDPRDAIPVGAVQYYADVDHPNDDGNAQLGVWFAQTIQLQAGG